VPGTSAGDVISLTNDISGDTRTITIDTTSRTAGILNIGDEDYTNRFTLDASGGAFLTLDNNGNGAEINETGFQEDTISTPITLADNLAASVGGILKISGDIGQSGGAKTITKTGTGELILTGANSYSGITHLYSGTLSIQNNTALGTTAGKTMVAPGATVHVAAPLSALAEAFNISGAGVGGNGALRIGGGGTTNMTGAVTLGGNATIGTDGSPLTLNMTGGIITAGHGVTFAMNGAAYNMSTVGISGAGFVVINGGTATFNVANSYSGGTTVSDGTLTLGTATNALGSTTGTLTVNGGTLNMASYNLTVGNLTGTGGAISGTASGNRILTIGQGNTGGGNFYGNIANGSSGTTSLSKVGTGVITLSGSTNSYTGATLVNAGTLRVTPAAAVPSLSPLAQP
jgi:autotransporter-associated beta strand protein